jgi:hypothetical protein
MTVSIAARAKFKPPKKHQRRNKIANGSRFSEITELSAHLYQTVIELRRTGAI